MRLLRRVFLLSAMGVALLFHFTNCGQVQPQTGDGGSGGTGCEDTSCAYPGDNLEISWPDGSGSQVLVASTDLSVEFSGTCNPSTYPTSGLGWRLFNGSDQLLAQCVDFGGSCGRCNSGVYSFAGATAINFPYVAGLGWYVVIEIQGVIPMEGKSYPGTAGKSTKRIAIVTP